MVSYISEPDEKHMMILPFMFSLDKVSLPACSSVEKREVFLTLCENLSNIHQKGVIHRDVKSANIGIKQDELGRYIASPIDFGYSLKKGSDRYKKEKQSQVGSPRYMSPESIISYADGGYKADFSDDIWAMGITLLEQICPTHTILNIFSGNMLTPFRHYSKLMQEGRSSLLTDQEASADPRYALIQKMLTFDPKLRPSMSKVTLCLRAIYNENMEEISNNDTVCKNLYLEAQAEKLEAKNKMDLREINLLQAEIDAKREKLEKNRKMLERIRALQQLP
jgi:serine/threonine protein kinase